MKNKNYAFSNAVQKGTASRKETSKAKKFIPGKFDKEGFFLAWGIGIVCVAVGILIIWATNTAPEGVVSQSSGFTTAQRLARVLPRSTQETWAFILASIFVVFGVFCIFLGLKLVVQYFIRKMRN